MKRNGSETIRKNIIKERGYICEMCGYKPEQKDPFAFLDLHHIIPVEYGGLNIRKNLILLCEKCHMGAHGYQKNKYIDEACKKWHEED